MRRKDGKEKKITIVSEVLLKSFKKVFEISNGYSKYLDENAIEVDVWFSL